jgi:hypothetical protein
MLAAFKPVFTMFRRGMPNENIAGRNLERRAHPIKGIKVDPCGATRVERVGGVVGYACLFCQSLDRQPLLFG